jgi:hypothetical protein
VPVVFDDLLAMHTEFHDELVHHQLQNGLIDYLWALKADDA